MTMYLVIGASGNVGREVVTGLLAGGKRVRVFTREASGVAQWGDQVSVAIGDLGRPDTVSQAMADVEGLYLMNRGLDESRLHEVLVSAKDKGVPRIVFLSTLLAGAADSQIGRLHKIEEDAIRDSGVPSAFIRPGGFMSNTFQWAPGIRSQGVVHNATGAGQFAPVAPEDIAAVTVRALIDPVLAGQAFDVTGAELLSVPQQVEILSRVIGRPLRCVDISVAEAVEGSIRSGVPPHIANALAQSLETVRDGRGGLIKDTVQQVTGKRPMSFEAWVRKHAARFA
jgi:uncharacterized protein YbjT (DUF2867 family)